MIYVFVFYGFLSLITFGFYSMDKSAAKRGKRRVPESTLHWLSFLGGWFGALMGQKMFRHKTKKPRFLAMFWLTCLVNIAVTGYGFYYFSLF
ncbi:uncharacterized membrane protein YsdA (DUF1294 family) [Marinomonas alcarazii]|uniref:Uncharacterized membrane protein YsdA (DUF1294 family) n=1 Tax=Marinomonas alcarazii TaxID=491949 RepID=A0A318V452_9GAMM|nr:DUF1294 domain-containing protein [Marinomonas alcarazii]PYF83384.1 uncharacterized membrane protein YsdA (DUF1294 family) [Marinomonas alcarazii]